MSISLNSKLKITTMPSYTFENTKTGEVYDDYMSIADMESFLEKNKHIKQVISKVNIVSGVSGLTYKNDQGWKEKHIQNHLWQIDTERKVSKELRQTLY